MKKISTTATAIVVLLAGIGAAYQAGRSVGFKTGSEWALVQADLVAQEAGVFMPVSMKDGMFRVVIKQPRGLYKRAWQQADQHEDARVNVRTPKPAPVSEHLEANNNVQLL